MPPANRPLQVQRHPRGPRHLPALRRRWSDRDRGAAGGWLADASRDRLISRFARSVEPAEADRCALLPARLRGSHVLDSPQQAPASRGGAKEPLQLCGPAARERTPPFRVGKLVPDHLKVGAEYNLRQQSRPGNPVHPKRARCSFVDVSREHVPDGRFHEKPMRLDASSCPPTLAIGVVEVAKAPVKRASRPAAETISTAG
jgi:hypothetical protein